MLHIKQINIFILRPYKVEGYFFTLIYKALYLWRPSVLARQFESILTKMLANINFFIKPLQNPERFPKYTYARNKYFNFYLLRSLVKILKK